MYWNERLLPDHEFERIVRSCIESFVSSVARGIWYILFYFFRIFIFAYSQAQIFGRSSGWLYSRLKNVRERNATKFDKNANLDSGKNIEKYQFESTEENDTEHDDIATDDDSMEAAYLDINEDSPEKPNASNDAIEYDLTSDNEADTL